MTRFVVYGAGAIGGVVGGRLFEAGHKVVLIARGAHRDAISRQGLRVESPDRQVTLPIPAVSHPGAVGLNDDDIVLLAMKSQDTAEAVRALAAAAPASTPVVCMQNGIDNERTALRRFDRVYGISVMCPALHLEPGVVQAFSAPVTGIMDIGRYPAGVDEVGARVSEALRGATFSSEAQPDIARWKAAKLLLNLGNAVEAVCGPAARQSEIGDLARAEGEAALTAAGIEFASVEEDRARRGDLLRLARIDGQRRPGGSSWQSLARGVGSIETDYLNGEIVMLGRLHGVPAPVNALLVQLANQLAAEGAAPGSVTPEAFLADLRARTSGL